MSVPRQVPKGLLTTRALLASIQPRIFSANSIGEKTVSFEGRPYVVLRAENTEILLLGIDPVTGDYHLVGGTAKAFYGERRSRDAHVIMGKSEDIFPPTRPEGNCLYSTYDYSESFIRPGALEENASIQSAIRRNDSTLRAAI